MTSLRSASLIALGAAMLLMAESAVAGPGFSIAGFVAHDGTVTDQLIAAYDKLNASPIMKDRKSRGILQAHVVDGASPSTHSFVVVFPSLAYTESFGAKVREDAAWKEFQRTLAQLGSLGETTRYQTLRSWGDISDADVVWENNAYHVANPAAFAGALERFMATATGKSIPGQVHLASVDAAGINPATHAIVVGWASEAEREDWYGKNANNAEWLSLLAEINPEYLGTTIVRTLSAYGATLKSTLGK